MKSGGRQTDARRVIHFVIPLAVMIFIFVQSAFPDDLSARESGFFVSLLGLFLKLDKHTLTLIVRKAAHFTEFLALGLSLVPAVRDMKERRASTTSEGQESVQRGRGSQQAMRRIALVSWLIGTLYAVTDEIHQIFVAGRSCELSDVLIDSAGVLCGVVIITWIISRRLKGAA